MARRDPRRLKAQALAHETRVGILALFAEDEGSLAAGDLLRDLRARDARKFKDTEAGQVFYHRICLQDAELLPV